MPRGGARDGAGRPKGSLAVVPHHHQRALEHLSPKGIRIPPGTSPEHAALADMAMIRMVDVLMEDVHQGAAPSVLKAACVIREEICGPIVKKLEIRASLEQLLSESMTEASVDR